MELNGLEADEHLVKTQMTVTKKKQNTEKTNKKQNDKAKKQTPKTLIVLLIPELLQVQSPNKTSTKSSY